MFDEFISFHAGLRPDAPAVVLAGREISFASFDEDVNRVAAELLKLPLAGETVSVAVRDEYLMWVTVLALARIGAASAPAIEPTRYRVTDQPGEGGDGCTLRLTAEQVLQGPAPRVATARRDPDVIGRLMHTSGTTGAEKKIALSWATIGRRVRILGTPRGRWLPATGIDTALGLTLTLAAWAEGDAVILGSGGKVTPDLLAMRPVLVGLVPDQLRRLLDQLPEDFAPMPEMRLLMSGGRVPPALAKEARRRLTPDLQSIYGASECARAALAEGATFERAGAAGYPVPGTEIEIVDADGNPLAAGERGLVRIRNDSLVSCYLNDAQRSAVSFRGGWFYPGDLGRILDDGLLMIDGRADDLMNFAGYKLLPGEIESAVATCAGVREVAALAVPDERGLDRCWLAIVPGEGFDPATLPAAIRRVLSRPPPIHWILISELPRNAMGKVERERLRTTILEQNDSEPSTGNSSR